MKKIFFLIFVYLFLSIKNIFSINFDNPIIPNNVDKKNLIINPRSPALLYENNKFKMWFVNNLNYKWNIDYIESIDGLNWKKLNDDSVIKSDNDELEIMGPSILKVNEVYHMWYFSLKNNDDKYFIRYAYSTDGFNWIKNPNKILYPFYWWESKGIVNPYVLYLENKFKMWYGAWGSDNLWRIGYAESFDGVNWIKNQDYLDINPNIQHVGNHSVKFINNKYYIWYVTGNSNDEEIYRLISDDGLNWNCLDDIKNCLVYKKNKENYPKQILNDLDTLFLNNKIYIYFTGRDNNLWSIGLIFDNIFNLNITSPSPTPTPSKIPIILLPGFMGSWNKNAILYNKDVNYNEWKLAPYVKEYDGIINTLSNIGYKKDEDFYIFPYDWRKSVEQTAENLDLFINDIISKNSQNINKFNLVGHSLGGLIGRIYTQKHKDKINKVITVGSPHRGTVQVYKPIEAGEIDRENTFLWLAQKLILMLNKSSIETNRETIRKRMPVIFDMFPVFDFLKNKNEEIIPIGNLSIKNNLLNYYNQSFYQIFDIFVSIYGEKDKKTPAGFIVDFPNPIDQFLGNYIDGYPKNYYFDFGDYTILTKSANQDEDSQKLILDHGEIIYKKEGIKKILDIMGLNYDENNIVEGKKTNIARSLIFLIKSPAEIYVENNDNVYNETDGIIFIPDAETGNFNLKVKGKDLGKYQVLVGQISENNDIWDYINGEIIKTPPESQIDNYLINYFQDNAKPIFPEETKFLESVSENSAAVLANSNSNSQNLNNNLNPTNNNKKNDSENLDNSKNNQQTNNLSNIRFSDNNQSNSSKESSITPSPSIIPIFLSKREENNFYQNDKNLTENNQKVLGEKTKKEIFKEAFNNKKTLSRKIILFFILMPSVFLIIIFIKKKNMILYNFLNGFKNISSYINKK